MSGGSYDYFYSRVEEKLLSVVNNLSDMSDVLTTIAKGEHWQQRYTGQQGVQCPCCKPITDVDAFYCSPECREKYKSLPSPEDIQALADVANDLLHISRLQDNIRDRLKKLNEVMHDVEWVESGDYGVETLIKTCKEVRGA